MRHYIRADRMQVGMTVDFGVLRRGPIRKILDITPAAWGEGYLKFSYSAAWGSDWLTEHNAPIQVRYHRSHLFLWDEPDEKEGWDDAPTIDPLYLPEHWTTPVPVEVPAPERDPEPAPVEPA